MNCHHTAVAAKDHLNGQFGCWNTRRRGWTLLLWLQLPAVRARKLVGIAYIQLSYHVLEISQWTSESPPWAFELGIGLSMVFRLNNCTGMQSNQPSRRPWESYWKVLRMGTSSFSWTSKPTWATITITKTMFKYKGVHQCTWHQARGLWTLVIWFGYWDDELSFRSAGWGGSWKYLADPNVSGGSVGNVWWSSLSSAPTTSLWLKGRLQVDTLRISLIPLTQLS